MAKPENYFLRRTEEGVYRAHRQPIGWEIRLHRVKGGVYDPFGETEFYAPTLKEAERRLRTGSYKGPAHERMERLH